jgi:hypothetical protein
MPQARAAAAAGCTALFEWCPSTHAVGVLSHTVSQLVLLSVRDNVSGQYREDVLHAITAPSAAATSSATAGATAPITSSAMEVDLAAAADDVAAQARAAADASSVSKPVGAGAVPVAAALGKLSDLNVKDWVEKEGVVLSLPNGKMYKLKCDWYVAMAQAAKLGGTAYFLPKLLEKQPLERVPAEKVWVTAIADVDDVVAACVTALASDTDAEAVGDSPPFFVS